ncbi:MAG: hypothetical protein IJT69_01120 [Clostridia bacterium]|nr:hypothetical protein [Clostridia bacterium]
MERYGVRRISGKGYENRNVIVRRRRGKDLPFLFFLIPFGGTVYLVAASIFRFAALPDPIAAAVSLLF